MKKQILTFLLFVSLTSLVIANNHAGENYFTDYSIVDFPNASGINLHFLDSDITKINDTLIIPELQFQHWFSSGFGFELSGGAVFSLQDSNVNPDYLITAELQYMGFTYSFTESLATGVYLWAQGGHRGYIDTDENFKADLTAALGIGSEFLIAKHISIPLEIGYFVEFPNNKNYYITTNAGIRFRF